MSKLICEVCESTDFVKQESMFVCQSCGLKYSAEEAKKMMSGDSAGNTNVGSSAKLDNLYQLARRARDENNSEKAAQYYEQILLSDPNNWEAVFYSTYYAAIQKWRNDDKGAALTSLKNCIGSVIDMISGTNNEYVAVAEISKQISDICSVFYEANGENFEVFNRQFDAAGSSDYNRHVFQQYLRQTSAVNTSIAQIYYVLGTKVLEIAKDNNDLDSIVEAAMDKAVRVTDRNPCSDAFEFYSGCTYTFPEVSSIKSESRRDKNTIKQSCDNVCPFQVYPASRNSLLSVDFNFLVIVCVFRAV